MVNMSGRFFYKFKSPIIEFDRWIDIYSDIKRNRMGRKFGYGLEVSISDLCPIKFKDLFQLKELLRLRERFYFLITHRKTPLFPVHVDGAPNECNAASINWPIINCDSSSMTCWYRVDKPKYYVVDGSYFLRDECDKVPLYETFFHSDSKTAFLFRSDVNHSVINMGIQTRIMVKWMTRKKTWNEAYEFYKHCNLF